VRLVQMRPLGNGPTRCDCCGSREGVREFRTPYGRKNTRGRYFDLCPSCVCATMALEGEYIKVDTGLPVAQDARHAEVTV